MTLIRLIAKHVSRLDNYICILYTKTYILYEVVYDTGIITHNLIHIHKHRPVVYTVKQRTVVSMRTPR